LIERRALLLTILLHQGEALQQPFQEGMDRLLGAAERPQGAALDEQVATERVASTPRAATFEQFPMTSTSQVSIISILQDDILIVPAPSFIG
jgi:hypothetical protein